MRRVTQRTNVIPPGAAKPKPASSPAPASKPATPSHDAFTAELDLTGWRGLAQTVAEAKADFDTPLMKQFVTDLKAEAARRGVTVHRIEEQIGRWRDGLEPSLKVEVSDGRVGVLKLAATLGRDYNQDAVLVLSKGDNATVWSIDLPADVDRQNLGALLDAHELPGSTSSLDGRKLTLVSLGSDEDLQVKAFLDALEGETETHEKRGADFIDLVEYAKVLALEEKPTPTQPYDLHFPVKGLTK